MGGKTQSRSFSKPSSTLVHVILPVLVVPVPSDVKPSMSHHSDVSTKPSGSSVLVLVKQLSETSRPSLNVFLMSSSTPPRDHPTLMLSRRRTNSNVSPNLTDKWVTPYTVPLLSINRDSITKKK